MKRIERIGGAWSLAFLILTLLNNVNCDECTIQAICKCSASYETINSTADALRPFGGILRNDTHLDLCEATKSSTPKPTPTSTTTTTTIKPHPNGTSLVEASSAQLRAAPSNGSLHMVLSCEYVNKSNKSSTPHDLKNGSFALTLQYACDEPHPQEHPYSTGSVLVIIFFTCVFAYLGMGVAVRYFMLGARGIEVLPNLDFWRDFPALIRDGVRFLQNGCKARPSDLTTASPEGYDAI